MPWSPLTRHADGLGESPFWHPREQRLYWVDTPGRQVRRVDPATGKQDDWAMPSEPGCIAPASRGGLVIALRDGIYRARTWGGALELLAPAQHDPASLRFNDGKADPMGRFWAGTIYEPKDKAEAALFCLDCGALQRKAGGATTANGLAFSPDARTLYWADTPAHVIRAWDWEAQENVMSSERVFHQFPPKPAGWQPGQGADAAYGGRPDGAAIDSLGNYWVAMFEGGRVLQLSPAGEVLQVIEVPARCPTMPCFGGEDLRTLYLTTASKGRPAQELQALPMSGHVLALRVDVQGRPVDFFNG